MKKIFVFKLLLITSLIIISSFAYTANAQLRYTEKETIDGITIMYRWQRSNIFKRDSRTILNLRLINNNEYPVEITLEVGFYDSGVLVYRSEEHEKCFNPGERKRGGKAGLRFKSEEITIEDIESKEFAWDFIKFEVKETEECP